MFVPIISPAQDVPGELFINVISSRAISGVVSSSKWISFFTGNIENKLSSNIILSQTRGEDSALNSI